MHLYTINFGGPKCYYRDTDANYFVFDAKPDFIMLRRIISDGSQQESDVWAKSCQSL